MKGSCSQCRSRLPSPTESSCRILGPSGTSSPLRAWRLWPSHAEQWGRGPRTAHHGPQRTPLREYPPLKHARGKSIGPLLLGLTRDSSSHAGRLTSSSAPPDVSPRRAAQTDSYGAALVPPRTSRSSMALQSHGPRAANGSQPWYSRLTPVRWGRGSWHTDAASAPVWGSPRSSSR